jgi:hypothetical protein
MGPILHNSGAPSRRWAVLASRARLNGDFRHSAARRSSPPPARPVVAATAVPRATARLNPRRVNRLLGVALLQRSLTLSAKIAAGSEERRLSEPLTHGKRAKRLDGCRPGRLRAGGGYASSSGPAYWNLAVPASGCSWSTRVRFGGTSVRAARPGVQTCPPCACTVLARAGLPFGSSTTAGIFATEASTGSC